MQKTLELAIPYTEFVQDQQSYLDYVFDYRLQLFFNDSLDGGGM